MPPKPPCGPKVASVSSGCSAFGLTPNAPVIAGANTASRISTTTVHPPNTAAWSARSLRQTVAVVERERMCELFGAAGRPKTWNGHSDAARLRFARRRPGPREVDRGRERGAGCGDPGGGRGGRGGGSGGGVVGNCGCCEYGRVGSCRCGGDSGRVGNCRCGGDCQCRGNRRREGDCGDCGSCGGDGCGGDCGCERCDHDDCGEGCCPYGGGDCGAHGSGIGAGSAGGLSFI